MLPPPTNEATNRSHIFIHLHLRLLESELFEILDDRSNLTLFGAVVMEKLRVWMCLYTYVLIYALREINFLTVKIGFTDRLVDQKLISN